MAARSWPVGFTRERGQFPLGGNCPLSPVGNHCNRQKHTRGKYQFVLFKLPF